MKEYLVWNPGVYYLFEDALTFYLISATTFRRASFFRQLSDCLKKHQYQSYRIYQVFGTYDVVLRVWVRHGKQGELRDLLEQEVDSIRNADPWIAWSISDHWFWGRDPLNAKALRQITPEFVRSIQGQFDKPASWDDPPVRDALSMGILRKVQVTNDRVIFFTFVDFKGGVVDLREARNEIRDDLERRQEILCPVVYLTEGHTAPLMLKGEAKDLFCIGRLITDLNSRLAVFGARTSTLVACDSDIHGSEQITRKDITLAAGVDLAVKKVFPILYERDVQDKPRRLLEHWIREVLLAAHELPEFYVEQVTDVLETLIPEEAKDVDLGFEFTMNVGGVFAKAEGAIRNPSIRFVTGAVGSERLQATIDAALANTPTSERERKPRFLSIANRLTVVSFVIKQCRLSDDPDLLGNWGEFANLRNLAQHQDTDLSKDWQQTMTTVVGFLRRFAKLTDFIHQHSK